MRRLRCRIQACAPTSGNWGSKLNILVKYTASFKDGLPLLEASSDDFIIEAVWGHCIKCKWVFPFALFTSEALCECFSWDFSTFEPEFPALCRRSSPEWRQSSCWTYSICLRGWDGGTHSRTVGSSGTCCWTKASQKMGLEVDITSPLCAMCDVGSSDWKMVKKKKKKFKKASSSRHQNCC